MKNVTKKLFLSITTIFASVCLLFGGVFAAAAATPVQADTSLESEFTNNGQFTVSSYNGVPFEYVDGASEGLSSGYSGSVLKVTTVSGVAYTTLDFSASQILAEDVASIVVRIYSPDYSSADEFRTVSAADTLRQYGVGAIDMSSWTNVTLNASSISDMTDSGYLTSLSVGVRVKGGATVYYIDSVTVNMKADLEADFTNNGQFTISKYNNAVPFEYVDGASEGLPVGYSGSVLKVTTVSGVAYADFDFSASQILAEQVENIVVRIYSPAYTSADEFRTYPVGSSTPVQYGAGAFDMSTWVDVTLNANSIASFKDENGYLTAISLGVRVKGGATVYYIDSITVNMKVDWEAEFTSNGQFSVSYYGGNAAYVYSFVNGAAESLPNGYSGAVLKLTTASGAAYTNFDFTASKIEASKVASVVARVYSPDYTADDELRINNTANSLGGAGAHDLSKWCDVSLPLATITGEDGYLGSFGFGLRDKGTTSAYFYIDSITVNMKEEVAPTLVTFTGVHSWWNNYEHNDMYCSIMEFSGGIGIGNTDGDYSDVYAKATLNGQSVDANNLSFICRAWIDGAGDSIVMRWVTNPATGSVLHIPAGATFTNGNSDSNVYQFAKDMYVQFDGTAWALCDKPVELETATFIAPWGAAGDFNSSSQVLLQYSTTSAWDHTNKGDLASKITFRNSKTSATKTATESNITGWEGQKWIVLNGMSGYDIIEIAQGGTFGGNIEIPALTLYNVNGCWVTTAPQTATTQFMTIADGWNNNVSSGLSNTILSFDVKPLGDAADATNLAATLNCTSLMVKYNGTTFAQLYTQNSQYAISYAHGSRYFYFAIPESDLEEGAIFEIENGAPFMNNYLGGLKLAFTNGGWEIYKEYDYATLIGPWEKVVYNSENTVLLQYNSATAWDHTNKGDLASKITFRNSETGATKAATEDNIEGWDGQRWIVISGMLGYDIIEIAEGGTFGGDIIIPVTILYKVNGSWVTTAPHAATTQFMTIADGWNNAVSSGLSNTVLSFDVKPLGDAADATNLAATFSRTSLMVTYNGATFFDLYMKNSQYAISYAHGGRYFYFAIPEGDLVEGAMFEIGNGTPFMNNYLGALKLVLTNGAWVVYTEKNYNPEFLSMGDVNHLENGNHYGVSVKYNANGFTDTDEQIMAASSSGITVNGEAQSVAFWGENQLLFWISATKCVEGYNRYSHPTLVIEEGATVVNKYDEVFTLGAVTLYLVNGQWTTEMPDGWTDKLPTPVTYSSIAWNNIDYGNPAYTEQLGLSGGNVILIAFSARIYDEQGQGVNTTNLISADSDVGNKIAINGVPLKDVDGSYVCLISGYVYIYVPACEILTIEQGTQFYDCALSACTFYFNGSWLDTEPEYKTVSFDRIEWNNYDYNGVSSMFAGENKIGTPSNGFCGLFGYSEDLGGMANTSNMASKYLDIGSKFKVNGIPAKDIEGAYISYNVAQEYLYFYIPFSGLPQADVYTVTIEEGAKFIGARLPASTHYFYDGSLREEMPVVVIIEYGDITVNHRFTGEKTIDSAYISNVLSEAMDSVAPLAWTIDGVNYFAGDSLAVNATTTVIVTEAVEFETIRGAAVRIMNDGNNGIRFESRIGLSSFNALVEKYGESNVKTGTYIAPKALFDAAGLSVAAYFAQEQGSGSASKYVHISNFDEDKNANGIYNKTTYQEDGYIRYFGSLTNLNISNYYTQFFGVGYVTVSIGDRTVTVYGLSDVKKTNRTIYDVATMAYSDTSKDYSDDALAVLRHYISTVAVLTYSNGNLFADTEVSGREYTSVYTVTATDDGYEITSSVRPNAVVVNGKKVSATISGDGEYSFVLTTEFLDEEFGSSLRYGLAEPCKEAWGGGSDNSTPEMLAGIAEQMGVTSYRVWPSGSLGGVAAGNVVSLGTSEKASLKKQVKALVDAGVNEILFLSVQPVMPYTYEAYFVQDKEGNQIWVNREQYLAGSSDGTYSHIYYDTVAVPDPTSEAEAYAAWLKVQYDFYVLFANEVDAWKAEYGWNDNVVKFYFEGLNEPEFQTIIHKRGSMVNGEYVPTYFSTEALAQVLTDLAYYMTLAVGDCGEVTTPALTNISSGSGQTSTTGVYCDTLLATMYANINDTVAPTAIEGITPENTNDENDYFTSLNWHPYLPWFKEENADMYYGEIVTTTTWYGSTKKSAQVNSSYADMWVAWNNAMYQVAVNGGDTDKPRVFFTEFGFCDWGNPTAR